LSGYETINDESNSGAGIFLSCNATRFAGKSADKKNRRLPGGQGNRYQIGQRVNWMRKLLIKTRKASNACPHSHRAENFIIHLHNCKP
jgi:hypothetical protein